MTGFETVLLRVAGTAAAALVKSLLARAPGAGLARDPARPVQYWRKPAVELGAAQVRRLAEILAARLGAATARLPEHERLAALTAVGDAFAALGPLNTDTLFAADLDPAALAATVPAPPPGLSEPAEALYRRLVALCCAHAVEYATTLPAFGARANVELVRRTGELSRTLEQLQHRPDGAAHAFEERYAEYIARTHGRLQLFGLTLSRSRQEWPLDVAYISLAVSGEQLLPGEPDLHTGSQKAEHALAAADRVLLRGPAGSGKSTLIQWLAVNSAKRSFATTLGTWNTCVPFVLRLRSFTSAEALPLPEQFLPASGVPLTAPTGWTEQLMLSGRALVLIDGVDEVPQRLRHRTETWLRSLVSAFPKARYVVTTRPSAVPEDWLAGQGFTAHSLLPMEREDIRAFIGQWHAAARTECAEIDAYESSLLEAVGSRRDLGRLATNPLMCSLLCALNHDRRMQLPRARKELYDAALDMLLVRRDSEREISAVEGVHLTREEQTLLLQRLAYWLIRNGQAETSRAETVELMDEWLGAMPQVKEQGSTDQVFMHLLIRSGLLREPVKGSVDFVHRTFQDYLGAKAAVEARDFGVLVANAHDDTWDDVVRMAVGHARTDERARLLRGLLRRADRVKRDRSRLVLLAAACLEHAPELDPDIRSDIEARTTALLPPKNRDQAEELAKAGELVLELLPGAADLDEYEAAATVRTAALVGGSRALDVVARFRTDTRGMVLGALSESWGRFDTTEYAEAVLMDTALGEGNLLVSNGEQVSLLNRLPHMKYVNLHWAPGLAQVIADRPDLEGLFIYQNTSLADLSALVPLDRLTYLGVSQCPNVASLAPLTALPLRTLTLNEVPDRLSLDPLAALDSLSTLSLGYRAPIRRVADLVVPETLRSLGLTWEARHITLDGLDRWQELTHLTVFGDAQTRQLSQYPEPPPLTSLYIGRTTVDPDQLVRHEQLHRLSFMNCTVAPTLEPLRSLRSLTHLFLSSCDGLIDLSPLADLDQLSIDVYGRTRVTGGERIAPERLRFG